LGSNSIDWNRKYNGVLIILIYTQPCQGFKP
jgi:hypothetical protein